MWLIIVGALVGLLALGVLAAFLLSGGRRGPQSGAPMPRPPRATPDAPRRGASEGHS